MSSLLGKLLPKYKTFTDTETTADDPERMIVYSTRCSFWTDNWNNVAEVGGLSVCPACKNTLISVKHNVFFGQMETELAKRASENKEVCKGLLKSTAIHDNRKEIQARSAAEGLYQELHKFALSESVDQMVVTKTADGLVNIETIKKDKHVS